MIKKYEKKSSENYSHYISQLENDTSSKLLLKHFIHKKTNSFLSTNYKKEENNVLSSILKEPEIFDYRKINSNHINFNHNNIKLTRRSSMMPKLDNSIKKNLLGNTLNLKNYFQIKDSKGSKNEQYLPTIIINDSKEKKGKKGKSFHLKNNKKEIKIKNNDEKTKLFQIPQIKKYHQSTKNIKNIDEISLNIPKRKFKKMNTALSVQNNLDFFDKQKKPEIKEGKMDQNQELLYSKQINNYILKIYKTSNDNNNEKTEKKKFVKKKKINKKNPPKFTIKDYLNNFDPKKYIEKLKEKQKTKYIYTENFDEIKNKELDKIYSYIEYFVFKKNNNLKKKKDILEKIKEKNELLISRYKKDFIQIILNEILLKSKMKQKKIIYKLYMKTILIAKRISFHIYIKLSIIRHVIMESEEDENLYFFNLIKHLLYSTSNKNVIKCSIKCPFIKSCGEYVSPIIQRLTTVKKFIDSNKKKMYYVYFSIKFQYLDCETILKHYEENKVKIIPKNIKTKTKITSIEDNKDDSFRNDSDYFSTIENRIIMRHKSKKSTLYSKYKDSSTSKLLNINLTKNIIKLREPNFESEMQNKNKLNLNLNTERDSNNNNIIEISDSSNSYEYNNYIKTYGTKQLNDKNGGHQNLSSRILIQDDPQEIILKERRLLFEHFISLVQFSEYDKLFHLLKKSGKFLDLNYRFENGDTLLHIFVKHSVPQYLIKLLILYGADINSQNIHGDTALHIAVKNHKYKTIDLLIKMGASEYIYNNKKKNCWDCL
jgi:hypothetical protein